MPTVPTYSAPQVERTGLPSARRSPNTPAGAFGGGPVGPDLSGVIQVVDRITERAKQHADQLAVLDADEQLSRLETELLYNPETGALNKRGKDAFETPETVRAEWEKRVGELQGTLNNETQRLAVRRMASQRGGDIDRALQRHVAGEMKAYDDTKTEEYLKSEQAAATVNFQDPERVRAAILRQQDALRKHAARNGLPKEWVDRRVGEAASDTHLAVIDRMLNNGLDTAAKDYYAAHKAEVSGEDVAKVEKALQEGTLRGESQRAADVILTKHKDRQAAVAAAEKISKPELRDATVERVRRHFSEQREAMHARQEQLYLHSANLLDAAPGRPAREVIPSGIWSQLTVEMRNSLERRGEDPKNDDRQWLIFLDVGPKGWAAMSRAQFESVYWSRFDRGHRSRAEELWLAARNAGSKAADADPQVSATLTNREQIDNVIRGAGFVPHGVTPQKMKPEEAKFYTDFETEAARRILQFELGDLQGKRRANVDEVRKILDDMVIRKVFIDKNWFRDDPQRPASVVPQNERGEAYVPYEQIPPSDRNAIENDLKRNGKRVTRDLVQKIQAAFLMNDLARVQQLVGDAAVAPPSRPVVTGGGIDW
jgi:hypothetical protein